MTINMECACELTILMPCLNEAMTLGRCIQKARSFLDENHIIDTLEGNVHMLYLTQEGIRILAEQAGLKVLSLKLFEFGLNQIVLMEKLL